MHYFDIHSHLNFPEYNADRDEVIARMRGAGAGTIVVGVDYESSKRAVELAEANENVWACVGMHPVDTTEELRIDNYELLITHPKVVAVGECGLDFHHANKTQDFARQKGLFLAQIEIALKHDKPVMIHVREAYEEVLEILRPFKAAHGDKLRGNVHFFAADLETAKSFWSIGFTTSFTGAITLPAPKGAKGGWRDPETYADIVKNAPLDMIMSETDAPYVAPVPYRGKRNEPSYVVEVVEKIAAIRSEDEGVVRRALVHNASRLFGLGL